MATEIGIANGNGLASGGVGLQNGTSSGVLTVDVPAGATIQQVLLYWSGEFRSDIATADDTIMVEGVEVTGDLIGGPTFFFFSGGGLSALGCSFGCALAEPPDNTNTSRIVPTQAITHSTNLDIVSYPIS